MVTQIYACEKICKMYNPPKKVGLNFFFFFTKTSLKRQTKTLKGRIILFSNKSLGSILLFSLLNFWKTDLTVLIESFRGQIHFVNQAKIDSGIKAISKSQTSVLIKQIIYSWGEGKGNQIKNVTQTIIKNLANFKTLNVPLIVDIKSP